MHGHRDQTSTVVTLDEGAHQPVHGHAEVVEGLVGILLQFVAKAPEHDGRGVTVAPDPFRHVVLPQGFERHATCRMLACPLVIELIDDEDAVLVAKLDELATVGVVRGADMVDAILLHQLQALLDGTRIGGSAEGSQVVVVGIAFQQHFTAIEPQAIVRAYLYGTDAEVVSNTIYGLSLLIVERQLNGIKVRMLGVPQLRILNLYLGQLLLHVAGGRGAVHLGTSLVGCLSVGSNYLDGNRHLLVASACNHLC